MTDTAHMWGPETRTWLLSPCGLQRLNSGCQAWWQTSLSPLKHHTDFTYCFKSRSIINLSGLPHKVWTNLHLVHTINLPFSALEACKHHFQSTPIPEALLIFPLPQMASSPFHLKHCLLLPAYNFVFRFICLYIHIYIHTHIYIFFFLLASMSVYHMHVQCPHKSEECQGDIRIIPEEKVLVHWKHDIVSRYSRDIISFKAQIFETS